MTHPESSATPSLPPMITAVITTDTLPSINLSAHARTIAARRSLITFFILLIVFTALSDIFTLLTHTFWGTFFMMWSPGTSAILTRTIHHEGFADISFRWGKRTTLKAVSLALVIPIVAGAIAYGLAWSSHLTPLLPFHPSSGLQTVLTLFGRQPAASILIIETGLILLALGAEVLAATGEEIGWRGYLLTHLIEAGVPQPVLVSSLIWSLWHWPLFLFAAPIAHLPPQIVRASIFLVTITSLGCISARFRLETGNIWPSIILHASWNVIILEIFDAFTAGTDTSLWTGEPGIFMAITMVILAFLFNKYWKKQ